MCGASLGTVKMETFWLYSYFSNVLPLIKSVLKERPFFNHLNSFGPIINGQTYISPTNCLKYKTWVKVNYKKWRTWAYLYKFIMWKLMFSLTEDGARGGLNSEYPVITVRAESFFFLFHARVSIRVGQVWCQDLWLLLKG